MECIINNWVPNFKQFTTNDQEVKVESSNSVPFRANTQENSYRLRTEDFIGYELTMVAEVECVFVEKEEDCSYRVFAIVNERDYEVRSRIYDREMAILQANPGLEFEFNIISRRNRPLERVFKSNHKPYRHLKA